MPEFFYGTILSQAQAEKLRISIGQQFGAKAGPELRPAPEGATYKFQLFWKQIPRQAKQIEIFCVGFEFAIA